MKYKDIKYFTERCETHPDHQNGMISEQMLKHRLHEEIDELRCYIEGREWVGLTDIEKEQFYNEVDDWGDWDECVDWVEAKLKEKNT